MSKVMTVAEGVLPTTRTQSVTAALFPGCGSVEALPNSRSATEQTTFIDEWFQSISYELQFFRRKPITNGACCCDYSLQGTISMKTHKCGHVFSLVPYLSCIDIQQYCLKACIIQFALHTSKSNNNLKPNSGALWETDSFSFGGFFCLLFCDSWRKWNPVECQGATIVCCSKCIW